MTVIFKGHHDCEQSGTFLTCDPLRGAIVQCNDCQRYWHCRRTLYTDGIHNDWKPVRWWNHGTRRRIRQHLEQATQR